MRNTKIIFIVTLTVGVVSTAPFSSSQEETNNVMFWWRQLGHYMMETKEHLNKSHLYIPSTDRCEYYPRISDQQRSVLSHMLIAQFYLRSSRCSRQIHQYSERHMWTTDSEKLIVELRTKFEAITSTSLRLFLEYIRQEKKRVVVHSPTGQPTPSVHNRTQDGSLSKVGKLAVDCFVRLECIINKLGKVDPRFQV